MGKTLSIELGIRCNNRCAFCYQLGWRHQGNLVDPTQEAVVERLRWGRDNGHDEVGFSGGEPTLRADMVDLVRKAVALGYSRVSITTNGRRFSNREFAREILAAGLDSIGWSLHGSNPQMHDGLVGRKGAFNQVVKGMRNVADAARSLNHHVDQNLFVLVNRQNHRALSDICRVGRSHGIKLMILQPVIYSKGNVVRASSLAIGLKQLHRSISKAARDGKKEEWFVKLFNLPPCFFADQLDAFEHQRYPVNIFRYQDRKQAGETLTAGQGYVRLDRCSQCLLPEFCPGLHQSLISQDRLLELAKETFAPPPDSGEIWLSGLELMTQDTVSDFLSWVRTRYVPRRLKLYAAGLGVAGAGLVEAAVRIGLDEISLVYTGHEQQSTDVSAMSGGNAALLQDVLTHPLLTPRSYTRVSLAIPFVDSSDDARTAALEAFARTGIDLELQLPWDFKRPELFEALKFAKLMARWSRRGGGALRIVVPDQARRGKLLFRHPVRMFAELEVASHHYATHFLSGDLAGWIAQSVPPFARGGRATEPRAGQPLLADLPGSPINTRLLDQMRPG